MMRSATGSVVKRLAALLLLAGLFTSCSSVSQEEKPTKRRTAAAEPVATAPSVDALCADKKAICIRRSPTRVAVVYLSRTAQQGASSEGLVVWNPGGPGLTPPPSSVRDRGLPDALDSFDILYFVEPWAVDPPSEDCLEVGALDASACLDEELVWSTADMRDVVAAAARRLEVSVVGVYGTSFGATANAELASMVLDEGGWAILENPAPPTGTRLDQILQSRADAMVALVAGWDGCEAAEPCHLRRAEAVRSWGVHGVGNLDPFDSALGLAALTTDPGSNSAFLTELTQHLDAHGTPSAVQIRALRRAAARFSLRGATPGSVQPALVGLWAGTCRAFGEASRDLTGLSAGLARIYSGCRDQRAGETPATVQSSNVLLLHGQNDAVVPVDLQRMWLNVYPLAISQMIRGNGHFRDDNRFDAAMSSWLDSVSAAARASQ